MRKYLFISILVALGQFLSAQENIIVTENKIWSNLQELCLPDGNQYTSFFHKFEGDTVFDGKTYKKVWLAEDEYHQDWFFYGALVREENKRVYYREFFGEEGLIYDFNIHLNDTVTIVNPLAPEGVRLTLVEIDSVETEEGYRERWKLIKDEFSTAEYWIEGIGSESGVLDSGTGVFGGLCGGYELLCYHDNNQPVYLNPAYETCYYMLLDDGSNMAEQTSWILKYSRSSEQLIIEFSDNKKKQIILTNLSGAPVYKQQTEETHLVIDLFDLPKGLYIITFIQNQQVNSNKLMVF